MTGIASAFHTSACLLAAGEGDPKIILSAAVSISAEAAFDHFGFLGLIWAADLPTSGARTQELMDWEPTGPRLIDDLEQGHYFQ